MRRTLGLSSALLLSFSLLSIPLSAGDDKNKNPDAIGDRDVGKGVNFYSLEKEIAIGKEHGAASGALRPRSSTIRLSPNTSTAWGRTWCATPTRRFLSPSK